MEVPTVSSRSPNGPQPEPTPGGASNPNGPAGLGEAPDGFEATYRAEWHGIVALGWSLTGSWATAEELAQDAFADAYRRWGDVSLKDRPGAWVRRAAINRAASHHRHRAVEAKGLARWSRRNRTDDQPDTDQTGNAATDAVGDPQFWAAVRALPHQQRAAVALHYLEDRSVADIAPILGCSTATVKVHLHRGRTALAERLLATSDSAARARAGGTSTPETRATDAVPTSGKEA